jgi:hypothetical protein
MKMNPNIVVLGLLLVGCTRHEAEPAADAPAGPTGPFVYATVATDVAVLSATSRGAPLAGVSFLVRVATVSPDEPGELLLQCTTGQDGACSGKLARLIDQRDVEVLVMKPGFSGSYSDENRRTAFGPFGPAAWVQVGVDKLATLAVDLQEVTP